MNGLNAVKTSNLRLLILAPAQHVHSAEEQQLTTIRASSDPLSLFPLFLKALTGTEPSKDLPTFAGYTSHPLLSIKNKYYSADVAIWCDELPPLKHDTDSTGDSDFAEWIKNMLSHEAKEVREVIGGLVFIIPWSSSQQLTNEDESASIADHAKYISGLNELRESIENDTGRDVASIAVIQDMIPAAAAARSIGDEVTPTLNASVQKLEDSCMTNYDVFGWDIIPWQSSHQATVKAVDDGLGTAQDSVQTNEYGEKLGMARILEILEQTDWTVTTDSQEYDGGDDNGCSLAPTHAFFDSDDNLGGTGLRPSIGLLSGDPGNETLEQSEQFQNEIMGLHFALQQQRHQGAGELDDDGDELQVDQLLTLMDRATEIKAAGAGMSKDDREKFARREVTKLMKDMNLS